MKVLQCTGQFARSWLWNPVREMKEIWSERFAEKNEERGFFLWGLLKYLAIAAADVGTRDKKDTKGKKTDVLTQPAV